MVDSGMIDKKIVGMYTKTRNNTNDLSQVRFGGYNEDLFKRDMFGKISHELVWIPTVSDSSWKIELQNVLFKREDVIRQPTYALINPSIPFVSAPMNDFLALKRMLHQTFQGYELQCTDYSYCYYST